MRGCFLAAMLLATAMARAESQLGVQPIGALPPSEFAQPHSEHRHSPKKSHSAQLAQVEPSPTTMRTDEITNIKALYSHYLQCESGPISCVLYRMAAAILVTAALVLYGAFILASGVIVVGFLLSMISTPKRDRRYRTGYKHNAEALPMSPFFSTAWRVLRTGAKLALFIVGFPVFVWRFFKKLRRPTSVSSIATARISDTCLEQGGDSVVGDLLEADSNEDSPDPLYDEAVRSVIESGQPSISFLQHKFKIG